MDINDLVNIIDEYFNILEVSGYVDRKETKMLLYLLFTYDYYSHFMNLYADTEDIQEIRLREELIRAMCNRISCLKNLSSIIGCPSIGLSSGKEISGTPSTLPCKDCTTPKSFS